MKLQKSIENLENKNLKIKLDEFQVNLTALFPTPPPYYYQRVV